MSGAMVDREVFHCGKGPIASASRRTDDDADGN
jgi:hypothetical protein